MKRTVILLLALCLLLTGCAGKSSYGENLMENVEKPTQSRELISIGHDVPETLDPETDESWDNVLIGDFGVRLFRASFEEGRNTLISP